MALGIFLISHFCQSFPNPGQTSDFYSPTPLCTMVLIHGTWLESNRGIPGHLPSPGSLIRQFQFVPMKLITTLKTTSFLILIWMLCSLPLIEVSAQVCANANTTVYGLKNDGMIYPITLATAAVGAAINPAYPGNSPSSANAMGYNSVNGKFYYFKRNADQSPQEFISFNPVGNIYTILASCPSSNNIRTGCINTTGTGYYCIDLNATLYYYDIAGNSWKQITSTYFNQFGANVSAALVAHSSGDIAIDGYGDMWFLCSAANDFGLFKFSAPLPTAAVASITAYQKIAPTTPTPTSNTFAGICFNPSGQIYMSTIGDDKLYRLNNNLTLTLMGTLTVSGVGNDLASCSYPLSVLATTLKNFLVEAKSDQLTKLTWTVGNQSNYKEFYIEYSSDGQKWQTVGFVSANTDPSASGEYTYTDFSLANGRKYYRIRQVDQNNQSIYSETKFIEVNTKLAISLSPNPCKGILNLQIKY